MDENAASASVDTHTKTARIRVHRAATTAAVSLPSRTNSWRWTMNPAISNSATGEQQFVLDAIRGDADLERHMQDAVRSLAVVLAAERSMHERRAVDI